MTEVSRTIQDYSEEVEKYSAKFNRCKSVAGCDRIFNSADNWQWKERRRIERRQSQIVKQIEALDGDIEEELKKAEELEDENIALSRHEGLLDAKYREILEHYDNKLEELGYVHKREN